MLFFKIILYDMLKVEVFILNYDVFFIFFFLKVVNDILGCCLIGN